MQSLYCAPARRLKMCWMTLLSLANRWGTSNKTKDIETYSDIFVFTLRDAPLALRDLAVSNMHNTFQVLLSVLDKPLTKTSYRQKLTIKALRKRPVLKLRFEIPELQDLCKTLTSNY